MCTAATYSTRDHYFGRNLDLEFSYHEQVTITPRNKPLPLRHREGLTSHYAMIGMAFVQDGFPLYYDATNEFGLSMAGLNFPGNAHYTQEQEGKINLASFEFIPYVLATCKSVDEARALVAQVNLTSTAFSDALQPSPLHWMIADQSQVLVFEQTEAGARIYENPTGVMTNNPTFDYQLLHLQDYMGASADVPQNHLVPQMDLASAAYSRGMGGFGIPGDLSSASRFVKVAFTRANSVRAANEQASVAQFFKILGSVEQQKGCCRLSYQEDGTPVCEYTIYSSCCNMDKGIYYYTTYENSQVSAVDMHRVDLESAELFCYDLAVEPTYNWQN